MPEIYSLAEAAQELGLTISALKYHIYQTKLITPQLVGHSFILTKKDMDEFKALKLKRGRPRKEPKE